jgi:hypothetical protein
VNLVFAAVITATALFLGMLLLFDIGRSIGMARLARDPGGVAHGAGPIEAAVFGLLGLLLAFTFSGAASRFEERRHLITEEANAIGTAYLRIDLLPADVQPELRDLFRRYLDTRLQASRNANDDNATRAAIAASTQLQRQIWDKSVAATRRPELPNAVATLVIPALNQMIDITTTRSVARQNHPPTVIYLLLAGLSLMSALLAGYVMSDTKVRSWFYMLIISGTISLTFYVIMDLEFPRLGLIRIDAADQTLVDLKSSMN